MDDSSKLRALLLDHDYTFRVEMNERKPFKNKPRFDCSKNITNLFKCKLCNYKSFLRLHFIRHISREHNMKSVQSDFDSFNPNLYYCRECGFFTFSHLMLMNHTCIPFKNIFYACSFCLFTVSDKLKNIYVRNNKQLFECDQCRFTTSFHERISIHQSMQHSGFKEVLLNHILLEHNTEIVLNNNQNSNQIYLSILPQSKNPKKPLRCKFFCKPMNLLLQKPEMYLSGQYLFSAFSTKILKNRDGAREIIIQNVSYTCSLCQFTVSVLWKLTGIKDKKTFIKCTQCSRMVTSLRELFIHKSGHHVKCKSILLKHLQEMHLEKDLQIDEVSIKCELSIIDLEQNLHFMFFGICKHTNSGKDANVLKLVKTEHKKNGQSRKDRYNYGDYICTYCEEKKVFLSAIALKHHLSFVHVINPVLPEHIQPYGETNIAFKVKQI